MDFPILKCSTPEAWIQKALKQQDLLLLDHAHCEKKAASTALSLIFKHPEHLKLCAALSRLAREELRHFEQVLKILVQRKIEFRHIEPANYAKTLFSHARTHEPAKLIDGLIIGSFVEARSCERFSKLVPHLDPELSEFYEKLLSSEARHYEMYLNFAKELSDVNIDARIEFFGKIEQNLIESPEENLRFHSGI